MVAYKHGFALLLLALTCSCGGKSSGDSKTVRNITFQTDDNYTIAATLYTVKQPNPAGLILVPMLGTTRDRWDSFARYAQSDGYQSIAIDMRGHGDSCVKGGQKTSYKSFSTEDWLGVARDIAAAKQALLHAGTDPDNIAVAGASIGSNLALQYACGDLDTQAVVMLSPGLNYHGVDAAQAMRDYGNRPVLLMTATGDAYSAQSCTALKPLAVGHCEVREYDGTAHGTDLFDAHETCAGQVLLWLSAIIGPKAAEGHPPTPPGAS